MENYYNTCRLYLKSVAATSVFQITWEGIILMFICSIVFEHLKVDCIYTSTTRLLILWLLFVQEYFCSVFRCYNTSSSTKILCRCRECRQRLAINPLEHSGNYVYHLHLTFSNPAFCPQRFHMIFRIKSDYFSKQHIVDTHVQTC
jgi:hypothetical protein